MPCRFRVLPLAAAMLAACHAAAQTAAPAQGPTSLPTVELVVTSPLGPAQARDRQPANVQQVGRERQIGRAHV